ncbi:hypothetical protein C8R44DRAFT_19621 [Mycena epipterygia]|nr:hypothetical protein C8R44DRAFT_19621 [Mycena epipterygia]
MGRCALLPHLISPASYGTRKSRFSPRRKLPNATMPGFGSSPHIALSPARPNSPSAARTARSHSPRCPLNVGKRMRVFAKMRGGMPRSVPQRKWSRISDAGLKSTQRWHRCGSAARQRDCLDGGGGASILLRRTKRPCADEDSGGGACEGVQARTHRWPFLAMEPRRDSRNRPLRNSTSWMRPSIAGGDCRRRLALYTFLFHSFATFFVPHLYIVPTFQILLYYIFIVVITAWPMDFVGSESRRLSHTRSNK